MTRLADLLAAGQSPWLDYIRRSLLTSGDLRKMVEVDGITGVTINPTIFDKAIAGSQDYDEAIRDLLAREPGLSAAELYERLAVDDVTRAADVLRPVFDRTGGKDGFVSLEVSPRLSHDTAGTVAEARRLWDAVRRPNLLIKVPGTPEGIPAIEELLASGINVNITLMFSMAHYEAVAQAYLRGLARAPDPTRLASVASVFVSRIDSAVDHLLDAAGSPEASSLRGQIAIANCRVLYSRFQEIFQGLPFAAWAGRGARPQRVLWASTSTKDPSYRDTMYVEELVGPETVDTIPPATLTAFEDHGVIRPDAVGRGVPEATARLDRLARLGIDLAKVTDDLQVEGVALFSASYEHLLNSLDAKKTSLLASVVDPRRWSLGAEAPRVAARLASWQESRVGDRVWRCDPTLWPAAPPADVTQRMGWLHLPEKMHHELDELVAFAEEVRAEGIRQVVVLGMGGSSLAPDVFARTFGHRPGYPELLVLDSTHPDAVAAMGRRIDPQRALFVVSSKSGTTTEPLSFLHYFWEMLRALGAPPGRHFIAITDPGTPLEQLAKDRRFRATFLALPTVGGRYSALTHFGLVPAALAGVNLRTILDRARTMAESCGPLVPVPQNPGLRLGAVLGELGSHGRDKLTFLSSTGFAPFPDWAEQLVAESTGKIGRGIVPVVNEPYLPPESYGSDRLFVAIEVGDRPDLALTAHTARLEAAGHPIVRFRVPDLRDLGQEFFRWELAVAVSGIILGIDPYDQPDVEFAKELARQAMAPSTGASSASAVATTRAADPPELRRAATEWMTTCRPGDYVGLQAYLAPTTATRNALESLRRRIGERHHVATTLGFGPRFLHSTGQLHKGGPPSGMFLQLVDTPKHDLEVPGTDYTFGQLLRAQALGDYQALRQKDRRVLRVDLGADIPGGLARLAEALDG
ncbi:MAG TPA: bifunctional transaldolase/phosoglucose isomerase [Thermoplasmata archaeon]|nr:bifunctional transaldolase/phosoglucose isomerase [Thermoplasmata archaeon]